MSEFDKEAERERLREKYERDQEDREAAQQMSDLLLKGATMTNAHCGECGSPIFRQNGQEFCPTCGARAEEEAEATGDGTEATGTEAATAGDEAGGAQQSDARQPAQSVDAQQPDARPTDGQSAADRSGAESPGGRRSDAADRTADATGRGGADAGRGGAPARQPEGRDASAPDRSAGGAEVPAAGDAAAPADAGGDAAAALQRALLRHARAADTADPRIARDHLAAAREAAEALAALRQ